MTTIMCSEQRSSVTLLVSRTDHKIGAEQPNDDFNVYVKTTYTRHTIFVSGLGEKVFGSSTNGACGRCESFCWIAFELYNNEYYREPVPGRGSVCLISRQVHYLLMITAQYVPVVALQ